MMANIMEKKRVMIIAHFCDAGSENNAIIGLII